MVWKGYCDRAYNANPYTEYIEARLYKGYHGCMGPCDKKCRNLCNDTYIYITIPSLKDFQEFIVGIRNVIEDGRTSYEFFRSDGALANVYKTRDDVNGTCYRIEKVGGNSFGVMKSDALCLKRVLTALIR